MTALYQVDAFTAVPFRGNPAGVCLLDRPADPGWMQRLAAEMNLSETAFVTRRGDGTFDLRWFTPVAEVKLCGHATLASAHVLWETGRLPAADPARFHTLSGQLVARRGGEAIVLDFPAAPTHPLGDGEVPPGLAAALGAEPVAVARGGDDLLVELVSEAAVRAVAPDLRALAAIAGVRGVCVTAAGEPGAAHDFVSRFFAPRFGVDEDPVTGSAHCALGPYWAPRVGRDRLTGYQASARGGTVGVELAGDRVLLTGRAVTVFRAELAPPAAG